MHEITFSTVDSPAGGYYYYRPCRIFLMYWEQFGIESAMLHMFFRTNISDCLGLSASRDTAIIYPARHDFIDFFFYS